MNTIGVLLLAAATATGQNPLGGAHVGGMKLFRKHAVVSGPAPPGGMMAPSAGCAFGHQGCQGGATCPGAGGMGGPGGGAGGQAGRRFPNVRSQVFFVDPPGMKIGWQTAAGGVERVYLPGQLTVPARYNFTQGYIYRLKLTDIPGRPGLNLYPTVEVAPSTPATDAYLTHNPIPAQFTEEDFDQVQAGNFVTKVIYLPDPKYQELAIAGVETLVSTRLEPGIDPILEADRRGTILMIVRLGAIDLEMPTAGASVPASAAPVMTGPITGSAPGTVLPPGTVVMPGPENVPLESAPVTPAPAPTTPPATPTPAPAPPPPATETPAVPAVEPPAPAPDVKLPGEPPAPEPKPDDTPKF